MFALLTTALAQPSTQLDACIQLGTEMAIRQARANDVYALGESLVVDALVAGDVSGMVAKIEVTRQGRIEGDLQVLGAEVVMDGPVDGAVRGVIASWALDARVTGSVEIVVEDVVVGRHARIDGDLVYTSKARIPALERVVRGQVTWKEAESDGK